VAESLEIRLARLARERDDADQRYNDALTDLDQALGDAPEFPSPPPPYDASRLTELNETWNILAGHQPAIGSSLGGRLRGLVWRLVGPLFDRQRHVNGVLVDHLNRNVVAHEEAQKAITTTIALARQEVDRMRRLHAHLIQYLQTVTAYVDTKDRAVAGRTDILNAGLGAVSDDSAKRWASLGARDVRLTGRVDDALRAVDDVRVTAALAQQTALSLKREVEQALGAPTFSGGQAPAAPPDLNAFKYLGFENQFRGSTEAIRASLAAYIPVFERQADVLDLGCGRGEFLDLLRAAGIAARGIDLNDAMVEETRARGLLAERADALTYLRALPDASLGGIFAAQVVEHLPPDYLGALLEVAAHKTRPGGVIALETINPTCWAAFFESYIRDLTHVRPIHPETLQYLLRVSGFTDVRLEFRSPIAPADRLQPIPRPPADAGADLLDAIDVINGNIDRLNARMFSYQDFAAIGRRP
jgi:SAM-dependent methyltransferase